MLRLRRHAGAEQQRRNRALRALLDGESAAGVSFPGCLLTLTAPHPGDDVRGQTMGLQLQDLVTVAAAVFTLPVATALIGDHVHVLVTVPVNGRRQATIFAEHVLARAGGALRRDFLVVASDEIAEANDLRARCVDNDSAVEYLVRTGVTSGVLDIGIVRSDLVLDRIGGLVAARADLRSGLAERIKAHDAAKGTEFVASLLGYLGAFGDIAAASAALHIHQNTLRHRLRRAEALFSIEFGRSDRLLLLWIELVALTR
jgi:sugar diacid utilization regulator